MGMNHFDLLQRGLARTSLEKKRVREIIRKNPIVLHLEEGGERSAVLGIVGQGADEGVEVESVWLGDQVEHVEGVRGEAGEGVGGDELGSNEGVLVEVGPEDLGLDLFEVVGVGALVEVGDVVLEEAAVGGPFRGSDLE